MSTRYIWDKYTIIDKKQTATMVHAFDNPQQETVIVAESNRVGDVYKGGVYRQVFPSGKTAVLTFGQSLSAKEYPYAYGRGGKDQVTLYYNQNQRTNDMWYFDAKSGISNSCVYLNKNNNTIDNRFSAITFSGPQKDSKVGVVTSNSSSQYPYDDPSGSYWYQFIDRDTIDPYSLSYSLTKPEAGKSITISVSPRSSSYGTVYYQYQYSIDNGNTWTNIGSKTTSTSTNITVPNGATQFKARVLASDNLGFISTTWVVGSNLTVQSSGGDNCIGIGGTARQIDEIRIGIGGTAREVTEGYIGIGGIARKFYG